LTFLCTGTFTLVPVRIDLLHIPDCPNVDVARETLRVALAHAGVAASVREVEIDSVDAAVAMGLRGSPTILIDGTDPFLPAAGSEVSLSCRLFRTGDRVAGVPSVAQLVEVLSDRLVAAELVGPHRRRTDADDR